jgi:hypothetical protein
MLKLSPFNIDKLSEESRSVSNSGNQNNQAQPGAAGAMAADDYDPRSQFIVIRSGAGSFEKVKNMISNNADSNFTEVGSPAEALQIAQMLKPCVIVGFVDQTQDIARLLQMATAAKNDLKKGNFKSVLLSKFKDHKIVSQFEKLGIHEIIIEPIPDRQLQFKMNLQMKANLASRKKQKKEDELKKFTATKTEGENADIHMATDKKGDGFKEGPAQEIEEDMWLFKNNKPQKKGSKWVFRLEGPDPSEGEWQKMPDAPDGEQQWRWMPKNPEEAKKGGWQHKGDQPEADGSGGWNFKGIKPELCFVDADGNKKATKATVDADGQFIASKDSTVAKQKDLEKQQKKELEKLEKINAIKSKLEFGKEKTKEEAALKEEKKKQDEINKDFKKRGILDAAPTLDDAAEEEIDEATDALGKDSKNFLKKKKDGVEALDSDEAESDDGDGTDALGKDSKNFLKKKKDGAKALDDDDAESDDGDGTDALGKDSKNFLKKKKAAADPTEEEDVDDSESETGDGDGDVKAKAKAQEDSADKLDNNSKNFLKKKQEKETSDDDDLDNEQEEKLENEKKESTDRIEKMKALLDKLDKTDAKDKPELQEKAKEIRNKLKNEEEKLKDIQNKLTKGKKNKSSIKDKIGADEEDKNERRGLDSNSAEDFSDDDDEDDGTPSDGNNETKTKRKKDTSKDASGEDDESDDDADDLEGSSKNFLKKERKNPFDANRVDEELAESHSQITDSAEDRRSKWSGKDSIETSEEGEDEDHLNIESIHNNTYKAKTTEAAFKEYPLGFFGDANGIWESAGVDERNPVERKVFIFITPEVQMKKIPDVTSLPIYWICFERPLRSEKKSAWLFREFDPEKIEEFEKLPLQSQKLLLGYTPDAMKDALSKVEERISAREREIEERQKEKNRNLAEMLKGESENKKEDPLKDDDSDTAAEANDQTHNDDSSDDVDTVSDWKGRKSRSDSEGASGEDSREDDQEDQEDNQKENSLDNADESKSKDDLDHVGQNDLTKKSKGNDDEGQAVADSDDSGDVATTKKYSDDLQQDADSKKNDKSNSTDDDEDDAMSDADDSNAFDKATSAALENLDLNSKQKSKKHDVLHAIETSSAFGKKKTEVSLDLDQNKTKNEHREGSSSAAGQVASVVPHRHLQFKRPKEAAFVLEMCELALNVDCSVGQGIRVFVDNMSRAFGGANVTVFLAPSSASGDLISLVSLELNAFSGEAYAFGPLEANKHPPLIQQVQLHGGVQSAKPNNGVIDEYCIGLPKDEGGFLGYILIRGAKGTAENILIDQKYIRAVAGSLRGFMYAAQRMTMTELERTLRQPVDAPAPDQDLASAA